MLFLLSLLLTYDIIIEGCTFDENEGDLNTLTVSGSGSVYIYDNLFENSTLPTSVINLEAGITGAINSTRFRNNTSPDIVFVEDDVIFEKLCFDKPMRGDVHAVLKGTSDYSSSLDPSFFNCLEFDRPMTNTFTQDSLPPPKRHKIIKFGFFTFLLLDNSIFH